MTHDSSYIFGMGWGLLSFLLSLIENEINFMNDDNPDDISIFLYYVYILIKLLESEKK